MATPSATAIAGLAADFAEAVPGEAPASPFRPVTAQTPRQRQRIVPNDVMAVNGAAFDSSIDALISNPSVVHAKPSFRMSESEWRTHAARVFGAEQVEEAPAATPRGSRLQRASDEELERLEARLRDERDRRAMVEHTARLAEGDTEVDDLSDLKDADDLVYGVVFDEPFAETSPDEFLPYVGGDGSDAA